MTAKKPLVLMGLLLLPAAVLGIRVNRQIKTKDGEEDANQDIMFAESDFLWGRSVATWDKPPTSKTIHQVYVSEDDPNRVQKYDEYRKTWLEMLPDFSYKQWMNMDELRGEFLTAFPDLIETYDNCPLRIEQLDLARFAILYNHGGIFADTDAEVLDPEPLLAAIQNGHALWPLNCGSVDIFTLAGPPKHMAWRRFVEEFGDHYNSNRAAYAGNSMEAVAMTIAKCKELHDGFGNEASMLKMQTGMLDGPITHHHSGGHSWASGEALVAMMGLPVSNSHDPLKPKRKRDVEVGMDVVAETKAEMDQELAREQAAEQMVIAKIALDSGYTTAQAEKLLHPVAQSEECIDKWDPEQSTGAEMLSSCRKFFRGIFR